MAKFKCLASGNVFEYKTEHDIKTMKTHPGYEEVTEQKAELNEEFTTIRTVERKQGRPKKEQ